MTMTDGGVFGGFARDRTGPIWQARAALVAGAAAAALAALRPIVEVGDAELAALKNPGFALAGVAFATSLWALFLVSTRGLDGRRDALWGLALAIGGGLTVLLYGAVVDGSLRLDRIVDRYLNPDLMRLVAPDIARGALNTIRVTFLAEVVAILVGVVVATFRMSPRWYLRWPGAAYVDVVRGLPIIVLAFLISFGLVFVGITLGTFMAVGVTLVINGSAYVAEIFRAGIQSVPRGQTDAARSLGMTQGATSVFVVIPQAVRSVVPPLTSEFIALIKDSALVWFVVGFTVATRDLFGAAQQGSSSTFSPTPLVAGAIGYLIITIPLIQVVNVLERRFRSGLV